MRQFVQRYTEPLLARIPDLSAEPPKRQAAIGLAASLVVHLLLFVFFVIAIWLTPDTKGYQTVREEAPLEIEIMPPKQETEAERLAREKQQKNREMLFSRGLKKSTEKPQNPDFESDQDMVAGSELPANGLLPLPSQEGRTDLPSKDFDQQDVIIGATANAAESLQRVPKGDEPPPPLYKPLPVTQKQIAAANVAGPTTALPKVSSTPPPRFEDRLKPATPAPARKVPLPSEGDLVLATRKPATPAPVTRVEPIRRNQDLVAAPITRPAMATPPPQQMAALSTPPPRPSGSAAQQQFREQLEKSRIEGSISNRGRPGVNATGTPMAMYLRRMGQLIDSRWQIYLKQRAEWVMTGSVRVKFSITPDGRTTDVLVEANESNQAVADICAQAVRDSKLESLPPEAEPLLRNGRLEYAINFTLF